MNSAVRKSGPKPAETLKVGFCPLGLVSDNKEKVTAAADRVLGFSYVHESDKESVRKRLVEFLLKSPLLRRLQKLQEDKDSVGALEADLSSWNFLTAMTIRDCTLFLKVLIIELLFCLLFSHSRNNPF